MQEFISWDDIRFRIGEKLLSDRTLPLMFGEEIVELDLTEDTVKEALKLSLGELLNMGRPITIRKSASVKPKPKPKRKMPTRGPNTTYEVAGMQIPAYQYFRGMREYAAEHGIPCPRNEKDGTYRYSHTLRQEYRQHLASQAGSET